MKFDISRLGPALGLIGLCALLAMLTPTFLTPSNLTNVLLQSAITSVLAVGMTFVILTAGIDLGVGSVLALSGVMVGHALLVWNLPLVLGLLVALTVGALCGLINGVLITKGKLPPFIATLGMMSAARGMAYVVSGGRPYSGYGEQFPAFLSISSAAMMIFLMFAVFGVAWFLLRSTTFGRAVYAIGGNEEAAWLSGIPTDRILIQVYVLCGFLSGLAAIMQTSRLDSANANAGIMFELNAIAAVVIGGTSLMGGFGSVMGTLGGALIISVLNNGLNLLNVNPNAQPLVLGAVIVLAVLLDQWKSDLGVRFKELWNRSPALVGAVTTILAVSILWGAWSYRVGQTAAAAGNKYQIAVVLKTLNNPFWVEVQEAVEKEALKHDVGLIIQAPPQETDVERQTQIVENMISQGVDAIILAPCGGKELVGVVKDANDAGVPIFIIDSKLDQEVVDSQGASFDSFIGSDNFKGGQLAGERLAQEMNRSGNVAILEGITGHESTDARRNGFQDALKNYPDITIVTAQPANADQEKAFAVTQNMFQADPNIQGLFACNDVMAMGAVRALEGMDRTDVLVVGFDASVDGRAAIKKGTMLASVAQYPGEMGRIAIQKAVDKLQGKDVPATIGTKVEVIDQ
jgi:ribose transport system substrate-binding protein/ribose transport system permease protein